jgi:DNA primase
MNHRIMSFTARDITDQQSPPYLHLPKNKSIIDPKNAIFNYDTIVSGGDVLINEGAFDSMKLGDGAICTFGADISILQAVWLKKKSIRTAYILYDNDKTGRRKARKVARIIAPLSKRVEIVELTEHGDPGELSLAEAQILKDRLGFNL